MERVWYYFLIYDHSFNFEYPPWDALLKEVKAKIDRQARVDAAKNMENTL